MIRSRFQGSKRLTEKLRRIPREQRRDVGDAIVAGGAELQGAARRGIQQGGRSGEDYVRYNPKRSGTASAPGEFPKTDQGALVRSIFNDVDPDRLGTEVGSGLGYAGDLEDGTQNLEARPWLRPTFDALREKLRQRIVKAAIRWAERAARDKR